jgi:quercetin dioxygenase-like cupin family protein
MCLKVSHVENQRRNTFGNLVIRSLLGGCTPNEFNVFHAKLLQGTRAPLVRHRRTSEFVYCLKGAFTAHLNGKRHGLREGALIWIPAGMWHLFEAQSEDAEALAIFTPRLDLRNNPDVEVHARSRAKETLRGQIAVKSQRL